MLGEILHGPSLCDVALYFECENWLKCDEFVLRIDQSYDAKWKATRIGGEIHTNHGTVYTEGHKMHTTF